MVAEEMEGRGDGRDAARRFGWRYTPRQVIDRVIADHARAAGHGKNPPWPPAAGTGGTGTSSPR
jgi:hypothetical protein